MLASQYRLQGQKSFDKVREEGRILQSDNFGVSILRRKDGDPSRFGFVISAKISKLAVHRNRIKRALHEVIRQNMNVIPKGYDFVFLVKKGMGNRTSEEIMAEVKKFLKDTKFN